MEMLILRLAEDGELRHDTQRELTEVLLTEDLVILHDEELGGLLQGVSLVEVGETEHLHHILHGQILDGRILDLSFQWVQIVKLGELQEAGNVCLQNHIGYFAPVEIVPESPDHLIVVVDHGLLLLIHLGGHHGLHGGGLSSEDDAMAGELLSLVTDEGEVREDLVLNTHLLNSSSWIRSSH